MQNIFKYALNKKNNSITIYNGLVKNFEWDLQHEFVRYPSGHKIWFPEKTIFFTEHLTELILNEEQEKYMNDFLNRVEEFGTYITESLNSKIITEKMKNTINTISSHTYTIDTYKVGANGLELDGKFRTIDFVKGSRIEEENEVPGQSGLTIEQLLILCQIHLESVNQGVLQNEYNNNTLECIQKAIDCQAARTRDREDRKVQATYQK